MKKLYNWFTLELVWYFSTCVTSAGRWGSVSVRLISSDLPLQGEREKDTLVHQVSLRTRLSLVTKN